MAFAEKSLSLKDIKPLQGILNVFYEVVASYPFYRCSVGLG